MVTATIRRIAKSHLKIDFGEESIGVTEEHPFWSEDRNGWVSARCLKVNEVVRSTGNKLVSVQSITPHKQASVYNLEVNRSHSYLVGKSRLVVHNGCGEQEKKWHTIYRVPGKYTKSGLPYVGRTSDPDRRLNFTADGRDRTKAVIIEKIFGTEADARLAEQNAMNKVGPLEKLDNMRNEIAEKKWGEKGVCPIK